VAVELPTVGKKPARLVRAGRLPASIAIAGAAVLVANASRLTYRARDRFAPHIRGNEDAT
jgi:hypothetical protein